MLGTIEAQYGPIFNLLQVLLKSWKTRLKFNPFEANVSSENESWKTPRKSWPKMGETSKRYVLKLKHFL